MIRSVIRCFVKESSNEVRRNLVSDLLYCLIEKLELVMLFPHTGYFLGRTDLAVQGSIIETITKLLGSASFSDQDQTIWIYDDLIIRGWPDKIDDREIFQVEVSHKI